MPTTEPVGGYDVDIFDQLVGVEDKSFWFRARNRLIVQIVSEITRQGDSFLEIGCGTGYVLRALAEQCGLRVTGSELFAEGLEHARRRLPNADYVELDAREMPYKESFDGVGAFDVLEHIDDDLRVLKGLCRAVRPGGFVLLTVPQHPSLWSAADTYAHHVRRYRRKELVDRVRRAGLEPVRVTSFVTSLLPLMALSRWRQKRAEHVYDPIAELLPPNVINQALEIILNIECALIKYGFNLPAGGSLIVVAQRC